MLPATIREVAHVYIDVSLLLYHSTSWLHTTIKILLLKKRMVVHYRDRPRSSLSTRVILNQCNLPGKPVTNGVEGLVTDII